MVLQELMRMRSQAQGAERAIAAYLIAERAHLASCTARSVARAVHVAPSTVVRVCQKLGYDGYPALRDAMQTELSYLTSHFEDIDPNYPVDGGEQHMVVAHKMGTLYREIVDDTLGLVRPAALDRAVAMLSAAHEIVVSATGVQLSFAEGFRNKMLKIGRLVSLEPRTSAAFYRAMNAQGGATAFVLLSYSGTSERLLRIARAARQSGAPVLAITSLGGNTLAELADVVLPVSTREALEDNIGHFAMNVSTALLLDIVYACIFNQDYVGNYERRVETARAYEAAHAPAATGARDVVNALHGLEDAGAPALDASAPAPDAGVPVAGVRAQAADPSAL